MHVAITFPQVYRTNKDWNSFDQLVKCYKQRNELPNISIIVEIADTMSSSVEEFLQPIIS